MHTIDHYCYHSGLRGVNAGLKFAYAAATMLICLISRSLAAAALVLLANGILTVKKGRIPFPFYRKLMLVPLAFLILGTAAMIDVYKRQDLASILGRNADGSPMNNPPLLESLARCV